MVRHKTSNGYVKVKCAGHPRANKHGYVLEHILVAEKALGKYLPPGAVVHHVDEDKSNNVPSNLVICEDDAYHQLLHSRMRAYAATGDANAKRCGDCGWWMKPDHAETCRAVERDGKKPRGFYKAPLFIGRQQYDQRGKRTVKCSDRRDA